MESGHRLDRLENGPRLALGMKEIADPAHMIGALADLDLLILLGNCRKIQDGPVIWALQ